MMSESTENKLELDIIEELRTKFPNRKVVFEIGDNFSRKDIAEQLAVYGEVRNSSECEEFFEEQCCLYEIFLTHETRGVIAPASSSINREVLKCFIARSVTVNLLENNKLVGFVQQTMFNNLREMDNTENHLKRPSLSEQHKINLKKLFDYYEPLIDEVNSKISGVKMASVGRTLIVHPDHWRKGLGAHLKLIKLFVGWLFSNTCLEGTATAANQALANQVVKKFAEWSLSEILPMIPENERHKFGTTISAYCYHYDERAQYYRSYLTMIRAAYERMQAAQN